MPVIEALTGGGKASISKTATMTPCSSAINIYIKTIVFSIKANHFYIKAFNKASQTIKK